MQIERDFFYNLAQKVLDTLPPEDRFSEEDAKVIHENKAFLLSLEGDLVKAFYDSLFGHSSTRAVFHEGERPMREDTLKHWWQRTLEGPFDQEYWAWQAYVGLVHVRRKVNNTMMIGHSTLVATFVSEKAHAQGLPLVAKAIERLMGNVAAIVVQGYEEVQLEAVMDITGQNRSLVDHTVQTAIKDIANFRFRK